MYKNELRSLPEEIGECSNLVYLHVAENQLTHLPDSMGKLTYLSFLYLSRNKLSTLSAYLCTSLFKLNELYLSDNQLEVLPPEIQNMQQLVKLDVTRNLLTEIPPQIFHLTNLRLLSLAENQITSPLPGGLDNLPRLLQLFVDGNHNQPQPFQLRGLSPYNFMANDQPGVYPGC